MNKFKLLTNNLLEANLGVLALGLRLLDLLRLKVAEVAKTLVVGSEVMNS
jgi:hypothetical protein